MMLDKTLAPASRHTLLGGLNRTTLGRTLRDSGQKSPDGGHIDKREAGGDGDPPPLPKERMVQAVRASAGEVWGAPEQVRLQTGVQVSGTMVKGTPANRPLP